MYHLKTKKAKTVGCGSFVFVLHFGIVCCLNLVLNINENLVLGKLKRVTGHC